MNYQLESSLRCCGEFGCEIDVSGQILKPNDLSDGVDGGDTRRRCDNGRTRLNSAGAGDGSVHRHRNDERDRDSDHRVSLTHPTASQFLGISVG